MAVGQVLITEKSQKWRYRCPNGHTTWQMTNNHMWCRACSNQMDVDPEFWELYEQKTGETIPREQVILEA